MKEMQEMPQETDAIENRDFHTACFVILGWGTKEWPRLLWARFSEASSSGEQFSMCVPTVAFDFVRVVICPKHLNAFVLRGMVRARKRNRLVPLRFGIKLVHNIRLVI